MESLETYLRQVLEDRVRKSFKNMHAHWTDGMVQEEVDRELEEIKSRTLDVIKLIANGDR